MLLVVMGAVVVLVGAALNGPRDPHSADGLPWGPAGVALVVLFIGLTRFDTVKAVASLPVIVLFIGAVVWPDHRRRRHQQQPCGRRTICVSSSSTG